MSLEDIIQAVTASARTEAEHIVKAAQKAAAERVKAAVESARQDADRRLGAAKRAIEEDYARQLIQHKGAASKRLLERRNERLREIFGQAQETILGWPVADYVAVMRGFLERAAEDRGGTIRIHPEDAEAFGRLLAEFNQGRDPQTQVVLDAARPLPERGGFVFVGERYEVDQTLRTLLADLEHELAPVIAKDVFTG
jgi:vacuolar-type H+-ATPase subunit E/Vma4